MEAFVDRWIRINSRSSQEELGLVVVTCWAIWNDRNKVTHNEDIPPINLRSHKKVPRTLF